MKPTDANGNAFPAMVREKLENGWSKTSGPAGSKVSVADPATGSVGGTAGHPEKQTKPDAENVNTLVIGEAWDAIVVGKTMTSAINGTMIHRIDVLMDASS